MGSSRAERQPAQSITCPQCGMVSHHPVDVEMGYCGNCHAYTSAVDPLEVAKRFLRESAADGE